MMRLLRLHLASDEFDAADFYAKKSRRSPTRTPPAWPRRSASGRAAARAARARARAHGRRVRRGVARAPGRARRRQDQDAGGDRAQAHRAQRDRRQPRRQGRGARRARRRAARRRPAAVGARGLLRARRRALPRARRPRGARRRRAPARRASGARRRRAPALRARRRARDGARAAPTTRPTPCSRASQAPPDSELAFAVELGRAVEPSASRSRRRRCARSWSRSIKQKRHDRQRAVMLDAVQRASRLEAEKLVEALAQLYVDDVPRGTQERRRAERLFERVMLSRAYRRLGKGHLDAARDTFRPVADTTGSLEAHVGYVDLRLREGATPDELRADYAKRTGNAGAPVAEFVRAYLLARELPSLSGAAREKAIDDAIAELRARCAGAARQARAASGVGRASCTSATSTTARSPRRRRRTCTTCSRSSWWRATRAIARTSCRSWRSCSRRSATIASRSATSRSATSCPSPTTPPASRSAWSRRARSCTSIARTTRPPRRTRRSPSSSARRRWRRCARSSSIATRSTTSPPAASRARSRSTTSSCRWSSGERNHIVARLARAGAALGAGQRAPRRRRPRRRRRQAARRPAPRARVAAHDAGDDVARLSAHRRGLRANAHLRLGELDAAAVALERRRALAARAACRHRARRAPARARPRRGAPRRRRARSPRLRRRHPLARPGARPRRRLPAQDRRPAARRSARSVASRRRPAPRQQLDLKLAPASMCRTGSPLPSTTWPPRATPASASTSAGSRSTPPPWRRVGHAMIYRWRIPSKPIR